MDAQSIIGAVRSVTKTWAKQRKAEERHANASIRRRSVMTRSSRYTLKDAAYQHIEAAYLKASDDGTNPATYRQVMYVARGPIQEATDEILDDKYFTQTLLPAYLRDHRNETEEWDVVADARGHFEEPHTHVIVPLGTLDVRQYLGRRPKKPEKQRNSRPLFDTHGPINRFSAILFIEKEGFLPLFKHKQLAERFDIAIMSTKGMSVTASRMLVDQLCGENDIPLLVLHDFDKSGFSILGSLRRSNDRYRFRNQIKVIDLGLRLDDVEQNGLESEAVSVSDSDKFRANLRRNGATEDEIEFLASGQRVELNAFTSGELVVWIETKLNENGIQKVVPNDCTLKDAFRSALKHCYVQRQMRQVEADVQHLVDNAKVPASLAKKVKDALTANPARSWDMAIADIAKECCDE